jgi:hypothetical protein
MEASAFGVLGRKTVYRTALNCNWLRSVNFGAKCHSGSDRRVRSRARVKLDSATFSDWA